MCVSVSATAAKSKNQFTETNNNKNARRHAQQMRLMIRLCMRRKEAEIIAEGKKLYCRKKSSSKFNLKWVKCDELSPP